MYFAIAGISDKPAAEVEYGSRASEKRGGEAAGRRLDYVAGSEDGSCLRFPGLDAKKRLCPVIWHSGTDPAVLAICNRARIEK